jgi:hypothetical protein
VIAPFERQEESPPLQEEKMKLTVKTLQGVAFPIEAELTDTVSFCVFSTSSTTYIMS